MCQGRCQDLGPDSGHIPANVDFTLGADDKQANTKQGYRECHEENQTEEKRQRQII